MPLKRPSASTTGDPVQVVAIDHAHDFIERGFGRNGVRIPTQDVAHPFEMVHFNLLGTKRVPVGRFTHDRAKDIQAREHAGQTTAMNHSPMISSSPLLKIFESFVDVHLATLVRI